MTLTPAYGRDYKSAAAVKSDWEANKDFIIADIFDPYDGKPANREALRRAGHKMAIIRYGRLMKLTQVKV